MRLRYEVYTPGMGQGDWSVFESVEVLCRDGHTHP